MPEQIIVPGQVTVGSYGPVKVYINKVLVPKLSSVVCTNSADIQAGKATVKIIDYNKAVYNSVSNGDEIEIYMADVATGIMYGNKIWGGYVEEKAFDAENGKILIIIGKEYTNRLLAKVTDQTAISNSNSFITVEAGTIIKALMDTYQEEFTSDNVLTGTANTMTIDFLNMNLMECVKKVCQTFDYVFYINRNKDLVVRARSTVVNSTDYITFSDNAYGINQIENKEFLANSVTVFGKDDTVYYTASDSASIATNKLQEKVIVIASFNATADCQNYANSYLAQFKDPIPCLKTKSRILSNSDPLQFIQVISTPHNINSSYQIRELTHYYGAGYGLVSEATMSQKIPDLSFTIARINDNVSVQETKTLPPISVTGTRAYTNQLIVNANNSNPATVRIYVPAVSSVTGLFKMVIKGYQTANTYASSTSGAGSTHTHAVGDISVTAVSSDAGTFGGAVTGISGSTGDITYASFRSMANSTGVSLRTATANAGNESAHTHSVTITETKDLTNTTQTSPSIAVSFDSSTPIGTYTSDSEVDFSSSVTWTVGWHYIQFKPAAGQKMMLDVSIYIEAM